MVGYSMTSAPRFLSLVANSEDWLRARVIRIFFPARGVLFKVNSIPMENENYEKGLSSVG
jgi:hypothetical protein